ncbi:unnamed protein product [Aspergillus oryzae RIB40]|uniref:DNA, SC009 n=2 Tax=Aspergillus oryzae TaxID=5062 RepID=Q2UUA4_ASPOR|nr:unnamed protein product [Aspergillus oryzae RIB40]EIT72645.1 hypothetical protein Ao3042_01047 [Aspergillus oryzae 3.042]KDE77363.1 hypothetical protein AO1008_03490 [Aspergillus oryzae 100-8]BAE54861.1 unnamed protein product [Aspergillus oryzae RIB40]|eukprot:EIT72645.1 hypothetical protein Ao3042_01047 [Aspergillus oryzae 3.042]
MADVGLEDINASILQKALHIPATVKTLTQCNWTRHLVRQLLDALRVFREQRFFKEKWLVRFKRLGQLLRHGLVQTAMEVQRSIQTQRLDSLQTLDARIQRSWGIQPVHVLRGVHLDRFESLCQACFAGCFDVVGSVTADPCVDGELIADLSPDELVNWDAEFAALEIPQGDVDTGDGGHEDGATAVEAETPGHLPDVFDITDLLALLRRSAEGIEGGNILGLVSLETLAQRIERSFDGFCVPFEGAFTPAVVSIFIYYFDEKPSGKDSEILDGLDLGHGDCGEVGEDNVGKLIVEQHYRTERKAQTSDFVFYFEEEKEKKKERKSEQKRGGRV